MLNCLDTDSIIRVLDSKVSFEVSIVSDILTTLIHPLWFQYKTILEDALEA